MIHASGTLTTLFPSDGGQIRVDKDVYVQGCKNVRVSVFKDGHTFVLHFLEPLDEIEPKQEEILEMNQEDKKLDEEEAIEKSEFEATEKDTVQKDIYKGPKPFCDFSSFVAQFGDGMILTHSGYGPCGSIVYQDPDAEVSVTVAVPEGGVTTQGTPSPQPKATSPKSRKKMDEEAKRYC